MEVVKYSEYEGMGHTPDAVYTDPYVFEWLFQQSLACR
jgi:predicted peptidase